MKKFNNLGTRTDTQIFTVNRHSCHHSCVDHGSLYNMGLNVRNLSSGLANNKGTDHPSSLISTFVMHLLESITSRWLGAKIHLFLFS